MFKKILATLTAVLIGLGLSLVAVAAPASAHTGGVTGTAVCQSDGTWKVTWTYHQTNTPSTGDGSQANVIVTTTRTPSGSLIDGAAGAWYINAATGNENANGQTAIPTKKGNFDTTFEQTGIPGNASEAKVRVTTFWVGWSSNDSISDGTVSLVGGCDTSVTVSAFPSADPPTCTEAGKLVIPTQTGVVFSGGTNGAGPGTYPLVASAAPGYTLTAPYSKTVTVLPANGDLCEKVTIPVSTMSQLTCVAGAPLGSYTLPNAGEWVAWYVNDVKTTTPSPVTTAGTVKVQAKITAAGLAAGVTFTDGTTVKTYNHVFTAPPACGALAVTGSSPDGFVLGIAGALLLLGGAGIYFKRRLVTAKK